MKVNEIEALIAFIAKSGLEEVHIATDQIKLTIKKSIPVLPTTVSASSEGPKAIGSPQDQGSVLSTEHPTRSEASSAGAYITFKAPMVGTFYQASNPEASPFVQVGDRIQLGRKICVIEAMKLFNEIEADVTGVLVKVLVEDASPVEYDQPLFLIAPDVAQ